MQIMHIVGNGFTRRAFIASGAIAIIQRVKPAFAQIPDISAIEATVIENAIAIHQFSTGASLEEINFTIDDFVSLEYESRQQTFDALRQSDLASDIEAYLERLPLLMSSVGNTEFSEDALGTVRAAVAAIESEALPLIPEADSVEPIGIPSILPREDGTENDTQVVVDVIIESLGIGEPGLLTSIIQSNPELQQMFAELVGYISTNEWTLVAEVIEKILNSSILIDILERLSGRVKRRFAFGLALRAVPFVGWLYTIASIVMAIKSNYHRFSFA